uniref:Uncharacterized protein n=1 Tax=Opuntia streptacantha TaxID=393608 RepID=A0A7C9EBQ1_OPUST
MNLARIPLEKRLPFEFEITRVLMAATYVHRPMMIAVYLTNDKITDACCDLAPLEPFSIIELKIQKSYRIQLNCLAPKFGFEIAFSPEFPPSSFAVAGNESRMMTNLFRDKSKSFLGIVSFISLP